MGVGSKLLPPSSYQPSPSTTSIVSSHSAARAAVDEHNAFEVVTQAHSMAKVRVEHDPQ